MDLTTDLKFWITRHAFVGGEWKRPKDKQAKSKITMAIKFGPALRRLYHFCCVIYFERGKTTFCALQGVPVSAAYQAASKDFSDCHSGRRF